MKPFNWLIRIATIIFLIYFADSLCFSQKGRVPADLILFHGVVLDANTQTRLGDAQITINRSSYKAGGKDGTFAFYVYRHDTVIFSKLGYRPAVLFISDTLSGKEFIAGIYMKSDTFSIGEVVIVPRFSNLRTELMNVRIESNPLIENARNNLSIATNQAINSYNKLGDPNSNYEYLRHQQRIAAYEKGGIPSDKIAGISPLLLIPAVYLLIHGFPEAPVPPKPDISKKDLEEIQKRYKESVYNRK
jgi:hypothetical protein